MLTNLWQMVRCTIYGSPLWKKKQEEREVKNVFFILPPLAMFAFMRKIKKTLPSNVSGLLTRAKEAKRLFLIISYQIFFLLSRTAPKLLTKMASRLSCITEAMRTLMFLTGAKGAPIWIFRGCSFPRGSLIQRDMAQMSVRSFLMSAIPPMRGKATRL